MNFEIDNLRDGYTEICRAIMDHGQVCAPRGSVTRELLGATIHLTDPFDALPVGINRKVGMRIAAAEALQLCGGFSDAEGLKRISKHMAQFVDLGQLHGAYGPRVASQLALAVRRIEQDVETRRAVINVWDPIRDLTLDGMANYPCTTQLQFMVRGGRLNLHVIMRANDAWHGMAYDIFTFTQLQIMVAHVLRLDVGEYYHHATSLHLYDSAWDLVDTLVPAELGGDVPFISAFSPVATAGASVQERLAEVMGRARQIGAGVLPEQARPSETWYHEKYNA